jgi:hypothetical protein
VANVLKELENFDQKEAELLRKAQEVRKQKEARLQTLRSEQMRVLGEVVLVGLETKILDKSVVVALPFNKAQQKILASLELPFPVSRPKGWDKIE